MNLNNKILKVFLILPLLLALHFSSVAVPTSIKVVEQETSPNKEHHQQQKLTFKQVIANTIFKKKGKKLKKQKRKKIELLAILSPIFGLLGFATFIGAWVASFALVEAGVVIFAVLTFLLALGAILAGRKARKNIAANSGKKGKVLALVGIVLGSIVSLAFIINAILAIANS